MDKTEDGFKEFYTQMPWLSIPYGNEKIKSLKEKYKVVGIPLLIIVES